MSDSAAAAAVTALLPPPGPVRRYAIGTLVDSIGTGLFITGSMLFFTRVLGLSAAPISIGLSIAGLVAMVAAVPLGSLGDRFGHRRVWIVITLCQAALYASYPMIHSYAGFVLVVTLLALASVGASPARSAYLARITELGRRVRVKAYNQAVYNVGWSIGALGAGVALQWGTRTAFVILVLGNATSYLLVAVLLITMPGVQTPVGQNRPHPLAVLRDRPFLAATVLNGLLVTYSAVLTVALPLWIAQRTHAPRWSVAGIFLLNTIMVVTLQVRASRNAETIDGGAATIRRGGVALLLSCVVLAASGWPGPTGALLLIGLGAVLLTAGELLQSAGAWGLSYGLAPADRQGQYLAAWSAATRLDAAVGPVLVVALVMGLGTIGWLLLGVLLLALAVALAWAGPRAARRTTGTVGGAQ